MCSRYICLIWVITFDSILADSCVEKLEKKAVFKFFDTMLFETQPEEFCQGSLETKELDTREGKKIFYVLRLTENENVVDKYTSSDNSDFTGDTVTTSATNGKLKDLSSSVEFEEKTVKIGFKKIFWSDAKRLENKVIVNGKGYFLGNQGVYFSPTYSRPLKLFEIIQNGENFLLSAELDQGAVNVDMKETSIIFWQE
ncbi:MAG: hypothetical protein NZT61_01820 [Deltaproteobacteria bacterium]|nr:hypothetical protein [Deltaproteobacteria bacterium]MCX7952330.1 hypothetical protein [Deltaproteobacteria bacterium]